MYHVAKNIDKTVNSFGTSPRTVQGIWYGDYKWPFRR